MRTLKLTVPQLALIVGTRVFGALGIGLLLSERLDHGQRRAVGAALVTVGVLTTIPLAMEVLAARREARPELERAPDVEAREPAVVR